MNLFDIEKIVNSFKKRPWHLAFFVTIAAITILLYSVLTAAGSKISENIFTQTVPKSPAPPTRFKITSVFATAYKDGASIIIPIQSTDNQDAVIREINLNGSTIAISGTEPGACGDDGENTPEFNINLSENARIYDMDGSYFYPTINFISTELNNKTSIFDTRVKGEVQYLQCGDGESVTEFIYLSVQGPIILKKNRISILRINIPKNIKLQEVNRVRQFYGISQISGIISMNKYDNLELSVYIDSVSEESVIDLSGIAVLDKSVWLN